MAPSPLQVFVENVPEKRIAEALLRPYGAEIVDGATSSGAISLAQRSLLDHPERPVAVLLKANTEDEVKVYELRASVRRLLAGVAPEGWVVALAVPRLEAWAMTDPRIAQGLQSYLEGKATAVQRAVRIGELTKKQPFDQTALYQQSADFRALVDFLRRHSATAAERTESSVP